MLTEDEKFIDEVISECDEMSKDILVRLCKRVIKNLNQLEPQLVTNTDNYPPLFKIFRYFMY